jgi:hypothetical protein
MRADILEDLGRMDENRLSDLDITPESLSLEKEHFGFQRLSSVRKAMSTTP